MKAKRGYTVCKTADLAPGERQIFQVNGKEVGVFNIEGEYFALLNYCPHSGAPLCQGPVTGTTLPSDDFTFVYGYDGQLVRCAWHGWEFKIATGEYLVDPKIRAKKYMVAIENGDEVVVYM